MKNSIRQIFLSILVVGLVVNCLLTKTERRDKILGLRNGKDMTDYYVRLYFEHVLYFLLLKHFVENGLKGKPLTELNVL